MMLQKLDYLHNNPVKRGLVAAPRSTGGIRRRMHGSTARNSFCDATNGGSERNGVSQTSAFPNRVSILGDNGWRSTRRRAAASRTVSRSRAIFGAYFTESHRREWILHYLFPDWNIDEPIMRREYNEPRIGGSDEYIPLQGKSKCQHCY